MGQIEVSPEDMDLIQQYALDQLVQDAQGLEKASQGVPLGTASGRKTRRCRSSTFVNPDGTRGLFGDNAHESPATVVPLTFCNRRAKVQFGASGIFKPVATKKTAATTTCATASNSHNNGGRQTQQSRLQKRTQSTPLQPTPTRSLVTDDQGVKRQKVVTTKYVKPQYWVPSFRGQGSLTGIPLDANNGVCPSYPSQPPAEFIQPRWPDPKMLSKLAAGSAADLAKEMQNGKSHSVPSRVKQPESESAGDLMTLRETINRMGNMMETLNAKVMEMQESINMLQQHREARAPMLP
eukprot:TRINITY_DN61128_c0_g1_i1.p1 TRINITY_DN61128_c0_g1~~TRINITY_DN61128_c0_g1_i1.p1  ORF type:complete len:294 (+),score=16.75 TRINITY_DN61128_c0_g1_i1:219-1100(+)